MEKITYKDELLVAFNAQVLPESDLIRGDKNLFTFSPIQDELINSSKKLRGFIIKSKLALGKYIQQI